MEGENRIESKHAAAAAAQIGGSQCCTCILQAESPSMYAGGGKGGGGGGNMQTGLTHKHLMGRLGAQAGRVEKGREGWRQGGKGQDRLRRVP